MELSSEFNDLERISNIHPLLIAGPCSAETEDQLMQTARLLSGIGVKYIRAGIWKPRTRPGGFEGVGEKGLVWMKEVNEELGLKTAVEVATPRHVELALRYGIDILWIGARTSCSPFAVQDIADSLKGVDIPVLVKNPVSPDLNLWIGALERIHHAGITRLGAIHRGFYSWTEKYYRNEPLWEVADKLREMIPNLPVLFDPSHIGGKRELVAPLMKEAVHRHYAGFIVESHCTPDTAWTDASQQITPNELNCICKSLF